MKFALTKKCCLYIYIYIYIYIYVCVCVCVCVCVYVCILSNAASTDFHDLFSPPVSIHRYWEVFKTISCNRHRTVVYRF